MRQGRSILTICCRNSIEPPFGCGSNRRRQHAAGVVCPFSFYCKCYNNTRCSLHLYTHTHSTQFTFTILVVSTFSSTAKRFAAQCQSLNAAAIACCHIQALTPKPPNRPTTQPPTASNLGTKRFDTTFSSRFKVRNLCFLYTARRKHTQKKNQKQVRMR